jgi:hypothetical protein
VRSSMDALFGGVKSVVEVFDGSLFFGWIGDVLYGIALVFYQMIHTYVKHYVLHAPRRAFGYGSADYHDICYEMTGVGSSFWITNKDECKTTIDRNINSTTTAFLFLIIPYVVFYTFSSKDIKQLVQYVLFILMWNVIRQEKVCSPLTKDLVQMLLYFVIIQEINI